MTSRVQTEGARAARTGNPRLAPAPNRVSRPGAEALPELDPVHKEKFTERMLGKNEVKDPIEVGASGPASLRSRSLRPPRATARPGHGQRVCIRGPRCAFQGQR